MMFHLLELVDSIRWVGGREVDNGHTERCGGGEIGVEVYLIEVRSQFRVAMHGVCPRLQLRLLQFRRQSEFG